MPDFFIGPGTGPLAGHILSAATGKLAGSYVDWGMATPSGGSAPGPQASAASTGVNPTETQYALYGHTVPLLVIGKARIGAEIISGPWMENGATSGIVSCGVEADPTRTRTLVELAFDSEVVWTGSQVGDGTLDPAGFSTEPFTCRFYSGSFTQSADPLETAHFGADAIAYRPQILIAVENLPLANTKFKKFPYISGVFLDEDGEAINFGDAFERLAASPWVDFADFETSGLTDGVPNGGLIIAQDTQFLQLIQDFGRFYPTWDILQTDKLRIVDRGYTVTADITLDATRLMGDITINRQGQDTVKKDLELSTIDPDADYTIVPSLASRPRYPVAVTTSVGKDTAYLPAIMDSPTRQAIVTLAKYHEEATRKTVSFTAMAYGLEIEPGALVRLRDLSADFSTETFKVQETLHGANNTVECMATAILKCLIADPYWSSVVLLMGFEGADGSTGAPGLADESPSAHGTGVAGGQIDTSQFNFGGSSLIPPLTYDFSHDWELSLANSDQFTIECFVRVNNIGGGFQVIVGSGAVSASWFFGITETGTHETRFGFAPSGGGSNVVITSSGAALITATWYYVAVDKDASGKIRLYRGLPGGHADMIGSDTPANSAFAISGDDSLDIGQIGIFGGNQLDGWVDELRITKGVARYANNSGFSVPLSAFPRAEDQ